LYQLLGIFPTTPLSPYPNDSNSHENFDRANRKKIRDIGKQLNEIGGMSLMRQVGEAFARANPRHARKLETTWSGIGFWLG
jgi:hypothetical protein